jgi:hypothetical protein
MGKYYFSSATSAKIPCGPEFLSPAARHRAAQRDIHLICFEMCEVPISKHPLKSKSHKCVQRSAAQQEISPCGARATRYLSNFKQLKVRVLC